MKVSSEKWAGSASGELKISPFVLKDDITTHRMGNTERIMTTASTRYIKPFAQGLYLIFMVCLLLSN